MLGQLNMYGMDRVELAIERLKAYEPPEGYFVAFSGGKDSVVVKALCDMAGVKYDAHYSITTVDPPELVRFVKSFKDVQMDAAAFPLRPVHQRIVDHHEAPAFEVPHEEIMAFFEQRGVVIQVVIPREQDLVSV